MRSLWLAVAALGSIVMVADVRADTVYLKDGRSFWGKDVAEEDDTVILVRPDGNLTFPKEHVDRIERLRSTLPPFYSPPTSAVPQPPATGVAPGGPPGAPGTTGTPVPTGPAGPPAPSGGPPAPPPPPGGVSPPEATGGAPPAPPAAQTTQTAPTELPPAPPPPPLGGQAYPR